VVAHGCANAEGFRTTPSVVAFAKNGDRLVGQIAKRQAVMNPKTHFIQSSASSDAGTKKLLLKRLKFLIKSCVITAMLSVVLPKSKQFAPKKFLLVLRKLVEDASKYLGETVTQAVITVPAYFNDSQRQATKDGTHCWHECCGLSTNLPAASLAYGFDKATKLSSSLTWRWYV